MKLQILEKATELFLQYGFKSATMDDIAKNMGMSKKTIYKYFKDKDTLVTASINLINENIFKGITQIQKANFNAIQENFEIIKHVNVIFKNLQESPAYQLQKHYPKKYQKLISTNREVFIDSIVKNLEKGIKEGLYREEIDVEKISLLYHMLSIAVHFKQKSAKVFWASMLDYHTRAIATPKGLIILEEQQKEENNQ